MRAISFFLVLWISSTTTVFAQEKPAITPADYSKWETLGNGMLAPDGKWLAYGINRSNGENELRVRSLNSDTVETIAFGIEPAFSAESRWIAYGITVSEAEEEKLRKANKPIQRKLGILNLATRQKTVVDGIAAFAFSKDGAFLAMRRYPPQGRNAAAGDSAPAGVDREQPGVDVIVRNLSTGAEMNFGNVSSYAWQDEGSLFAMTINAEGKTGNGVHLYDPASGTLKVLDSSAEYYSGLTWKKKDDDLIVFRSAANEAYEEPGQVVLVWKGLSTHSPEAKILDPAALTGFPANTRIVKYRNPSWSDSGNIVFFGTKPWTKKDPSVKPLPEGEEFAQVEVWHARDIKVMPEQKLSADRDRQRNFLAAWHLESGRFTQLGNDLTEEVTPLKGDRYAMGRDDTPYERERIFGRPYTDLYVIDIQTGEKRRAATRVPFVLGASSGGNYILYFNDNKFFTYHPASGRTTQIGTSAQTFFEDRDDDHPTAQKSPYGIAGWTRNDAAVLVYDRYDVWELISDGTGARRLTNGASEDLRHRYLRLDPEEEFIDTSSPVYLSLYGRWSKRYGYARIQGDAPPERLVFGDRNIARLTRAKNADVLAYVVQDFNDSPDYFVGSGDLKDSRQVTATNAFQSDFAWGKSELVEFQNSRGQRLQGALFYPANYQVGRKYPMMVNIYELRSDQVHNYSSPSERSPYNAAVFTARGYFFFQPDIVFKERDPGLSIVDAVTAGVKKMIGTGMIDEKKIGLFGHSWGGYGTAYLATNTDLFAAAVAGAPLTDLVSMYSSVFWNNGVPETGHFEVGQERMQAPLWEDRDAYLRNSPIHNVEKMKTPLMVAFGDKDGNVDWHQGVQFYNMARRAGKQMVMLVYADENHSLRKKPNQVDYHRRIVDWFAHYIEGAPAPKWISDGMPFIQRQDEMKRVNESKK